MPFFFFLFFPCNREKCWGLSHNAKAGREETFNLSLPSSCKQWAAPDASRKTVVPRRTRNRSTVSCLSRSQNVRG